MSTFNRVNFVYMMSRLKSKIKCADCSSLHDIVEQLLLKDIDLDPYELEYLFGCYEQVLKGIDLETVVAIPALKVFKDLFDQGIYIPHIDDKVDHTPEGYSIVVESLIYPSGPIPVSKHNFIPPEKGNDHLEEIYTKAKKIHSKWNDRKGWKVWNDLCNVQGYQSYAIELARKDVYGWEYLAYVTNTVANK